MADPIRKITAAAKKLSKLRDRKEALEDRLKVVNEAKAELEGQILPQLMKDQEIEKMTIEGHGTLYLQAGVYASILAADTEAAHVWLKENGHKAIVKETVHHSTLRSWAKEQLEAGTELPAIFHVKPIMTARIRRK